MACLVAPSVVDEAKGLAARGCVVEAAASLLASSGCDGGATDASGLLSALLARCRAEPYACLGLAKPTDDASVKAAYRERALAYHPDKNGYDSTALFQSLGVAFERLRTATSRGDWEAEAREAKRAAREARQAAREAARGGLPGGDTGAPQNTKEHHAAAKEWNDMVAKTIDGFVSADAGARRHAENADRADRHRRASHAAAAKRREAADLAAAKKNRDGHRAWLRSQRLAREQSLNAAADKYRELSGGRTAPRPPAPAPTTTATATKHGAGPHPDQDQHHRGGARPSPRPDDVLPQEACRSRPVVEVFEVAFDEGALGLTLEMRLAPDGDEQTVVKACVPDPATGGPGAAERLGVQVGDVFVGVNAADARGYTFKKATTMIGSADWPRVLKFQRKRKTRAA